MMHSSELSDMNFAIYLVADAPDVLAHISVRSRQLGVLFAACFDQDQIEALTSLEGKTVSCSADAAGLAVVESTGEGHKTSSQQSSQGSSTPPTSSSVAGGNSGRVTDWCLDGEDAVAKAGACGAKSSNIMAVRKALPSWIKTPMSAVVPFGSMERTLDDAKNGDANRELQQIVESLGQSGENATPDSLRRARDCIMSLSPAAGFKDAVEKVLSAKGSGGGSWEGMWNAMKRVWASKWGERAFYSCR
jgi:alpha-glucan,water dikinase